MKESTKEWNEKCHNLKLLVDSLNTQRRDELQKAIELVSKSCSMRKKMKKESVLREQELIVQLEAERKKAGIESERLKNELKGQHYLHTIT